MKKILITGGAGFIGSNIIQKLYSSGYEITVIDNLSPQIHGENALENSSLYLSIKDKVNFTHDTILNKSNLEKAIGENEIILHLAAETGTGQSMYNIQNYVDVNSNGTALLLDILANTKTKVQKIVVASSRAIYGEGRYIDSKGNFVYPKSRLDVNMSSGKFDLLEADNLTKLTLTSTDEDSKIHPSSVYGITKQTQEDLIMTVCPTINIQPVALRYQNVFGAGQSLKNPYTGILSIFSTLIKQKQGLNIFEDGDETRDFIYIDDVVDATILAIEKSEADQHVFNVGTGIATKVIDVAQQLVENYGIEVPITITGNYRLGDIRHNYADISKIKRILKFEPKVSFLQGLKLFTNWVNSQEIESSLYQKSIDEMKQKGLLK